LEGGLYLPGDAKALVRLEGKDGKYLLAGSQNKNVMKIFEMKNSPRLIPVKNTDRYALLTLPNGQTRKQEFYFGSSFLSQSSNFILDIPAYKKIEIINAETGKRTVR